MSLCSVFNGGAQNTRAFFLTVMRLEPRAWVNALTMNIPEAAIYL